MPSAAFKTQGLRAWSWVGSAYFRLCIVSLELRYRPMSWLRKKVEFSGIDKSCESLEKEDSISLLGLHEAVRLAARLHLLPMECLPKSLVLVDMLKKREVPARVKIGVAKVDGTLASHAWVEVKSGPQWTVLGEIESVTSQFKTI